MEVAHLGCPCKVEKRDDVAMGHSEGAATSVEAQNGLLLCCTEFQEGMKVIIDNVSETDMVAKATGDS